MKFYFNEDNPVPMCVICGNNGSVRRIFFCEDCGEWLCKDVCENRWDLRGLALMMKGKKRLSERFA